MSDFKPLQKDVCDLPVIEAPKKICPTCTIDPNYVEPTWYNTSTPYLNLKLCEYQVSITSRENPNTTVNSAHLDYIAQKSVKKGVREIIRHFSKLELDSIVCAYPPERSTQSCRLYLPPKLIKELSETNEPLPDQVVGDLDYNKTDPEGRFNLAGLEVKAYVKELYFGDNSEIFKVLISIPAEDIDLLPESPFSEDDKEEILEEARTVEPVVLDGRSFKNNILQAKAVFKLYARYQSLYYTLQKVSILQDVGDDGFKKLRLTRFPQQFEAFKDTLEDVLKANNFKLRRHKGVKIANKIKFVFDNSNRLQPYNIKAVYAKYPGCKYKKLKNIQSLKKLSQNQTLMHYIANLEDMIAELENTPENVPWLDYIAQYTYPPVTIDFGNADSKNEELDSCIDDQYLSDIKDRILEEAMNFREVIEFQFSSHNCQTIQDYNDNNLVSLTKKRIKEENLTKEQRKAKREAKQQSRQENREEQKAERERQRSERERLNQSIEALEDQISSIGLATDVRELQRLYVKQASVKDALSDVERLSEEVKALKKSIRLLKKLPQDLSDGFSSTIETLEQREALIKDLEDELSQKQDRLKELKRTDRHKKFPVTNALSKENIKRLWNEARGPEPKKKSLFTRISEADLQRRDRRKTFVDTRAEDRVARRSAEGLKNKREIRKKQGRTIMSRLNPCDWNAVLFETIECLLGGMSLEEAVPIIVRTTLSKSSPFVLEKILQGLPPEVQKKVEEEVKNELRAISTEALRAFKAPWQFATEKELAAEDSGTNATDREKDLDEITQEQPVEFTDQDTARITARIEEIKESIRVTEQRLNDASNADLDPQPPAPPLSNVEWMDYKHKYKYEPTTGKFFWKQYTVAGGLPENWSPVVNDGGIQAVKSTWTAQNPNSPAPWDNNTEEDELPALLSPDEQQSLERIDSLTNVLEEKQQELLRWETLLDRVSDQPEESVATESPQEAKEKRKKKLAPKGVLDLSRIANVIFEAYVDALILYAGIDALTEMIDKIPGANIFKKIFLQVACPTSADLKLGIEDLFGTLKVGICDPDSTGYFLPSLPNLPSLRFVGIRVVLNSVIDQFREALVSLIESVILALFVKILEYIEKAQCQAIGALGSLIANQVAGQDGTRNGLLDAINDAFCGTDGNPLDTQDDLLSRAGMPSAAKTGIANGVSRAMSPKEIKQALLDCSTVPNRAWSAVYAVIEVEYPDLLEFITGPEDVKEIFCTMGSLMSPSQRFELDKTIQAEAAENLGAALSSADGPIDGSICLDNQQRNEWDERRKKFYQDQGLPKEAADKFVDDLNSKALSDLSDLLDLLVNGPEGILDNFFDQAFSQPDPDCIESLSIIPKPPQELQNLQQQISEGLFGSISLAFKRDMIGHRHAFIDNILADSRGLRLTGFLQHESRVDFDLLFPNAANSIESHRDKYDKSGYLTKAVMAQSIFPKDEFEENQDGDPPRPDANHLFPKTIGLYCREKLLESVDDLAFETSDGPTFTLGFRDVSEDEDYAFDKGFNLNFRNTAKSNRFNRSGNYSVRMVNVIRAKDEKIQKRTDYTLRIPYGLNNVAALVNELDEQGRLTQPYANYLFERYVKSVWAGKGDIDTNNMTDLYDSVNTMIMKRLTKSLLEDPRSPDGLPVGFKFGYNDDSVTYEDLLYVNPEATDDSETWEYTYEEEDRVLGKSATNHKRVKFLQPEKYGGRFTRPKIYIEPATHDGWYRILQVVVPELDGCEPRRTDFLNLEEVSERVSKLQNSIATDKRMEFDEDCTHEPPFDKLLPPASLAYLEGAITAIIRTYAVESILRTMPIVSQLKLDFANNYDDGFLSLVVDKMEEEMTTQDQTFSRISRYTYWILFLDQTVQMSFRKIKDGTLPQSEELIGLLKQANQISKNYLRPDRDDIRLLQSLKSFGINDNGNINSVVFKRNKQYSDSITKRAIRLANSMAYAAYGPYYQDILKDKVEAGKTKVRIKTLRLKVLIQACREYQVHTNIKLCKEILKHNIRSQLEGYGKLLDQNLAPQAYIGNLSKFFIGASGICKNHSIQAGLSEVENPVGDSSLPYGDISEVVSDPTAQNPLDNVSISEEDKQSGVFFLEKYLVITPKEMSAATIAQDLEIRYPTQFSGVTGIGEFQQEMRSYQGDLSMNISEALGNARISTGDESLLEYDGSIGIKFGVRLCYAPPQGFQATEVTPQDRAFKAKPAEGYAASAYYFPVAKYEQDIMDRKLEELNLDDKNLGEDLKCYVDRLTMTEEYKLLINSLLVTQRVPSLIAFYLYDGFIDSLGLGENEREEGKESRGNERWKGKILDDTKDRCRALFASFYRTMEKDKDSLREARDSNLKSIFGNLMPKGLFNIDGSVKWWQRSRIVDRPYDRDGKDCADDLNDIFGE